MEAHQAGICCKKLAVQSAMTYAGTYTIQMDKGIGISLLIFLSKMTQIDFLTENLAEIFRRF